MLPVLPWRFTLLALAAVFVLVFFAARVVQPAWWRSKPVRVATFVAMVGSLAGLAMWAIGHRLGDHRLALSGCGLAYVGLLVVGPAAALMPIGAAIDRGLSRAFLARSTAAEEDVEEGVVDAPAPAPALAHAPTLSRRALVRAGGASLPVLGAAGGIDGFVAAEQGPRLPVVRLSYEGLHPDLDGLRILHLSDIHLGGSISLERLQAGLDAACATGRPDLVVVTGDIADDPSLLAPAMERVARAAARYGAFASLGNHEYLGGIDVTRPILERSAVPLLVSTGRAIRIGRARLFVAGADDPVHMHGDIAGMLGPSIRKAAAHAPADADFRLLLCHRPEGLGPAAENGFDLVLAGHTHGGQLGLFGRSVFEALRPGVGWWGRYERARPPTNAARASRVSTTPTRLYTTSGFGHWFPFRVGCPTELPIVVLERAPARPDGMTALSRKA